MVGPYIDPIFFSYPSKIALAFWRLTASGELPHFLGQSLEVLLFGLLAAIVAGIPLAVLMARIRWLDWALDLPINAFYATPLDMLLRQLKCKRLVITGLATDNCVLFTAMDAYVRGYSLWIPEGCVAAERDDAHAGALDQMRRVMKAKVHASTAA